MKKKARTTDARAEAGIFTSEWFRRISVRGCLAGFVTCGLAHAAVTAWVLSACPVLGAGPAEAGELVILTVEHVDLRIRYQPAAVPVLDFVVANEDAEPPVDIDPTQAILQAAESAKLELPGDLPPLGSAGEPIWVLPASQREGILNLGISAEENPFGVFEGPLEVRLLSVDGPGHFFLWQAEVGSLRFWMNSKDGLDSNDAFPQPVGGHSHLDWGFSTSGVYRLTLQAVARRVGETTNLVSDPTVFTFHILPLPPSIASPFEEWQAREWPGESDPEVVGPESDPDGDDLVNLWEYALGLSPRTPDPKPLPGLSITLEGSPGQAAPVIRIPRAAQAVDVEYRLWVAERPGGPWRPLSVGSEFDPGSGDIGAVTFRDPEPVGRHASRYYRADVQLINQP